MACPHGPQGGARSAGRVHILSTWGREGRCRNLGVPWNERGVGPRGETDPAGPRPVQLRYQTGLTGEAYVRTQAWRDATLERCPNHLNGGCSLARHGTYARKTPRGTKIARWYCPESHTTFSLLPECLAARLPGELDELERVVAHAEQAASLSAAADALRRDAVELPGAMRWVERRVRLVHHVLGIVIGLLPEQLARCIAEMGAVRTVSRDRVRPGMPPRPPRLPQAPRQSRLRCRTPSASRRAPRTFRRSREAADCRI